MSKKKDVHVVPHKDGGWATKKEGTSRSGSRHDTQRDAIARAREQAIPGENGSGHSSPEWSNS